MIAFSWDTTNLSLLAMAIVGLLLSGYFSGMEMGIYALNKMRLDLRAEAGIASAKTLKWLIHKWNNLLTTIMIGNNLVNYMTTFTIGTLLAKAGFGTLATEFYMMAIVTPLLFIFGESVPKNLCQRQPEFLVYRGAMLMRIFSLIFNICGVGPLFRAMSSLPAMITKRKHGKKYHVHSGVASIVAEGHASGVLTHSQSVMADRVMRMSELHLRDIMTPIKKAACISERIPRKELMIVIDQQNHSRLPMLNEHGQVTGILNVYEFLLAEDGLPPASKRKLPFVLSANMNVADALVKMRNSQATMAIIEGALGRHIGIITLKDLVEEIVGELEAW